MNAILCFFGSNGSGKSTLSRALAKNLMIMVLKVKVSWTRGTCTLASLLVSFLHLRLFMVLVIFTISSRFQGLL